MIKVTNTSDREAKYGHIAVLAIDDDGQVTMEPHESYKAEMVGQEQRLGLVASDVIAPGNKGRVQIAGPFAATVDMIDMFSPL